MSFSQGKKKKSNYKITPEEMWTCLRGQHQIWGIEGYEVPRKYFDHYGYQWNIKRSEILNKPKRQWPPNDWKKDKETDKSIPPIRTNFIDDVVKLAKSFNDPVKSQELKEQLEPRGTFKEAPKKEQVNLRDKFLKNEEENNKRRSELPKIPEYKVGAIEAVQQKIQDQKANEKTYEQIIKEKYTKDKPQWPKCDRVTIVADAEYVGEQIPFYNTPAKEGEDGSKKELFFPSKEPIWRRSPSWNFMFKKPTVIPNDQMNAREEQYKEKIENLKNSRRMEDKDLIVDSLKSSEMIYNRGKIYYTIHKPFDYAGTDQYKQYLENKPDYSPGPQHYWQSKEDDTDKIPKEQNEEKEFHGKTIKVHYMNRKRTDAKICKPMKSYVF